MEEINGIKDALIKIRGQIETHSSQTETMERITKKISVNDAVQAIRKLKRRRWVRKAMLKRPREM